MLVYTNLSTSLVELYVLMDFNGQRLIYEVSYYDLVLNHFMRACIYIRKVNCSLISLGKSYRIECNCFHVFMVFL